MKKTSDFHEKGFEGRMARSIEILGMLYDRVFRRATTARLCIVIPDSAHVFDRV